MGVKHIVFPDCHDNVSGHVIRYWSIDPIVNGSNQAAVKLSLGMRGVGIKA